MIYQHLKTSCRDGDQEFPAIRFACRNQGATGCSAQSRVNNGNERIGAHPPIGGYTYFFRAFFGLESGANSSPDPVKYKPRSMHGLGLTFYDAALRFVTSRRQYRAGTGGRPGLFLAGRRIGGNGWQTGAP